jgi:hypothetical protein
MVKGHVIYSSTDGTGVFFLSVYQFGRSEAVDNQDTGIYLQSQIMGV